MPGKKDVTVPMPEEMVEAIENQLEYGDSRAGWIREAVQQRLERDKEATEGNPSQTATVSD